MPVLCGFINHRFAAPLFFFVLGEADFCRTILVYRWEHNAIFRRVLPFA